MMGFCSIKAYMRDRQLQQPPLLVLPHSRCDRVQGIPTVVEPIDMSEARAAQMAIMATIIEKEHYGYTRAAHALRELARRTNAPQGACPRLASGTTGGAARAELFINTDGSSVSNGGSLTNATFHELGTVTKSDTTNGPGSGSTRSSANT